MTKYRKKPVVIDAVQWTGENFDEVYDALGPVGLASLNSEEVRDSLGPVELAKGRPVAIGGPVNGQLRIETLEGTMLADPGDWIIKGVAGELYPCKPEIFAATYYKAE
jgi:hypothetical protein